MSERKHSNQVVAHAFGRRGGDGNRPSTLLMV